METKTKYKCGECGLVHDDEFFAEDCCKPDIEEVTIYICDKCKEEHDTKKEAFECCDQTKLNPQGCG